MQTDRRISFQESAEAFARATGRRAHLRDQLCERMRGLEEHLGRTVNQCNPVSGFGGHLFEIEGLADDGDLGLIVTLRIQGVGLIRFRVDPSAAFHVEHSPRVRASGTDEEMGWQPVIFNGRPFSTLTVAGTQNGIMCYLVARESNDRGTETVPLDQYLGYMLAEYTQRHNTEIDALGRAAGNQVL
jgi:hypothetical protein